MSREHDISLLKRALAQLDSESEEKRIADAVEAFTDMLSKLEEGACEELTKKQRTWVHRILDEPEYEQENLVSNGKVPRGREVPTPAVLRNLPLKPPGRR